MKRLIVTAAFAAAVCSPASAETWRETKFEQDMRATMDAGHAPRYPDNMLGQLYSFENGLKICAWSLLSQDASFPYSSEDEDGRSAARIISRCPQVRVIMQFCTAAGGERDWCMAYVALATINDLRYYRK